MADKNKERVNVDQARLEKTIRRVVNTCCPPRWIPNECRDYDGDCKRCWIGYLTEGGEDHD